LNNGISHAMDSAMTSTITMDAAGRVVLPAQIRKKLHLQAGSKLRLDIVADRLELTPEPEETARVTRKGGRLVLAETGKPFDAAATVRAERDKQARRAGRR
jgi:AbrB family looped-hinge helix DNA binding protein